MAEKPDLSHLNDMQAEAVLCTEGPLLVLAGAGSGKTRVLIERTAHIIRQGTPAWRIMAITFTNKAAGELKKRLEQTLGPEALEVWACTFHSACARILRRDIEALGYGRSFTIYDTDDTKRVMRGVLKALNLDEKRFAPQALLSTISRAKDAGQSPDELMRAFPGDYFYSVAAECYKHYQKQLFDANALDFDDLISLTVRLFRARPDVLEYYQNRFAYILIDEYQDTNRLQYQLVSMLAEKNRNICVVGDDDQSIYRFRGATIENILGFKEQYPDAKIVRLEQNYRSTGAILDAANRIIKRNQGRMGKTLWTGRGEGEQVSLYAAFSENDEARHVAETIAAGVRAGASYGDFCVLYRMNAQSGRIENQFRIAGIPYRVFGGMRFFDRAEIKDMMAYLQIIHNPDDDLRLMRVINNPPRGLGEKTLSVVSALAERDSKSCFAVLRESGTYPELARAARTLESFARMIEELREAADAEMPLPELYDRVLEETGYAKMLRDKGGPEAEGKLENVLELKTSLTQYQELDPENSPLGGFLEQSALSTDLEKMDESENAVVMMTIHAAKGLEFPVVFLVGCEEGIFPGNRSQTDPSELEEERRLCYVAVTRAEQKLHMICARERMLFGFTAHNPPSRFIAEMELALPEPPPPAPQEDKFVHRTRAKRPPPATDRSSISPPAQKSSLSLACGDRVTHKSFGGGLVTAVTPMGGDALLEIAFDGVGTKRLMLKTASAAMQKN